MNLSGDRTRLNIEAIRELLLPFTTEIMSDETLGRFQTYLELIQKWNAKFNLTAIREAQQIVTRHFGEGVFTARFVPPDAETMMDLGSGVGIPGIPVQIMCPKLTVTLVEAQQKRASFLQETVRALRLGAKVRAERAEGIEEKFDVVALRAVEKMGDVVQVAAQRLKNEGRLLVLAGEGARLASERSLAGRKFTWTEAGVPGTARSVLRVGETSNVPRGTFLN
jgi:16S rRNA (guanine527-N7)-methyltransferase